MQNCMLDIRTCSHLYCAQILLFWIRFSNNAVQFYSSFLPVNAQQVLQLLLPAAYMTDPLASLARTLARLRKLNMEIRRR